MEDHELLGEYVERRSDQAFAALVERHIDLVYSTALRSVRDPHLARDVVQKVFILLARKPSSIRNAHVLAGWLYRTTRFTAASTLRAERRRREHEQTAMDLNTLQPDSPSLCQALAPYLDEAMDALDPLDQGAVALRFFEGKSLREVGLALGMSDDAAQKRVARAVERLRSYFARKGLATSSALVTSVLAAHAAQAAPAGLASSIAAASLAQAAGGGSAALAWKLIGIMTTTNLKITGVALLILAAVSTPILLNHRARGAKPAEPVAAVEPEVARPAPATQPAAEQAAPAPKAATPAAKKSPVDQLMEAPKLSVVEIEAYLQQNKRNVESLLAAFRVSGDKAYLREAATSFPNNPAVQFAVIAFDVFPEQRRQWLEAFKGSSPDNAVAWYLSALDYFKTKQPDLALQELGEASHKTSFSAYVNQASQAVEEMYDLAGRPALEAKYASTCGAPKPHVAQLKSLAEEMIQVQQQYQNQGDTASANSLAYMGLALGNRLGAGANNQSIIDQLVGIAIEKKVLAQLDATGNYDFLGRPVSEVAADLDRQKQSIRQATEFKQQLVPSLNETDLVNYLDREKVYGEPEATAWLQAKYGQR
jgi:RNA polymerase sigma factor (sigma-70 family)